MSLLDLIRRLLAPPTEGPSPDPATAASGLEAVVALEAALGATVSVSRSLLGDEQVWAIRRHAVHLPIEETDQPRQALATAIGRSLSGQRAACLLTGPEIASAEDQLARAAALHLPLVVHVVCPSGWGAAGSVGSGHDAVERIVHLPRYFATNAQEAIDLTLRARAVAERALVPAVVAMDASETGTSIQDVHLPSSERVRALLGDAADDVEAPTSTQRMLFGPTRRRVPRWYDLDDPLLHGALHERGSWGAQAHSQAPYFDAHLARLMTDAADRLSVELGRPQSNLRVEGRHRAPTAVLLQGAVAERVRPLVSAWSPSRDPQVETITVLTRPLPEAELSRLLADKKDVVVLERTSPRAGTPLSHELAALLYRHAASTGRAGPRITTLLYGLGPTLLDGADLEAALRRLPEIAGQTRALGVDFLPTSTFPKRQALLDQLAREHPDLADRGLTGARDAPRVTATLGHGVTVHRVAGHGAEGLVDVLAAVIHRSTGAPVRTRRGHHWEAWDAACTDEVRFGDEQGDLTEVSPADLSLVLVPTTHHGLQPAGRLRPEGAVLIEARPDAADGVQARLSKAALDALVARRAELYALRIAPEIPANLRRARLAGAAVEILRRRDVLGVTDRQLRQAYEAAAGGSTTDAQSMLAASFEAGRAGVEAIDAASVSPDTSASRRAGTPAVVRKLGGDEGGLTSLPRFFTQVGALYREDRAEDVGPDPYLAAAAIPPLSSTFRSTADARLTLPAFNAARCTGCGACWTMCPDGALGPLVLQPRPLIEAGMDAAARRGVRVDALRPKLSKLTKRATRVLAEPEAPANGATWIRLASLDLNGEDQRSAVEGVASALEPLQLATTDRFFKVPEQKEVGTGRLLTIAVNPDACKGCAGCVAACPEDALTALPQTPERIEAARQAWLLWEELPDTPGPLIETLRRTDDYDELTAVLLSRTCRLSLGGGDGVEAGSGAKTAIRQVLASAELYRQRALAGQLAQVDKLLGQLRQRVSDALQNAVSQDDHASLNRAIEALGQGRAPLADLAAALERTGGGRKVDTVKLQRLLRASLDLEALGKRIRRAGHGLGRARLGLVLAPDARDQGLAVFPYNPFQAPVAVDATGEPAATARGLVQGLLHETLDGIRTLRRASLELDGATQADIEGAQLAELRWRDLTAEERAFCAPILVVGPDAVFSEREVTLLLDSDLPVKLLVLSDVGAGLASAGPDEDAPARASSPGLVAVGHARAVVAQSSIAHAGHLSTALEKIWRHPGPGLLCVHAPSPASHGYPRDETIARARAAVESRASPLFIYDPERAGVFGSRLDLEGNPNPQADWHEPTATEVTSPIAWLHGEERFAHHFDAAGEPSTAALAFEARCQAEWRILQELAGLVSPFTDRVEARLRSELAAKHAADLDSARQTHEQAVADLRQRLTAEIQATVREGLRRLAQRGAELKAQEGP